MRLESDGDLRAIYRPPARGPVDKVIDHLDEHCAGFLAKSPFFVLSTAERRRRLRRLTEGRAARVRRRCSTDQRLAWADLSGNNRLDSFQNLVTNSSVALLFMIPGLDETLRVNGPAELVTDPELCERFAIDGKPARSRRGRHRRRGVHPLRQSPASGGAVVAGVVARAGRPAVGRLHRQGPRRHRRRRRRDIEAARQRDLQTRLWKPGGERRGRGRRRGVTPRGRTRPFHPAGRRLDSEGHNTCARSSMDRASDYGSEGWGFDSLRAR